MGQEISGTRFTEEDFDSFSQQLAEQTAILRDWFAQNKFESSRYVAGLELEAWLVDRKFNAAPVNDQFLSAAASNYLTPELAKFNIELNVDPCTLGGDVLKTLQAEMQKHWQYCQDIAESLDTRVMAMGILPTLTNEDLVKANMSKLARYEALNEQVLNRRLGQPIGLHIIGKQNLQSTHYDVMLEAAATSLQVHIQVPQDKAVAYYNSSVFISALMVACGANSPYLFKKNLWEESRIPLFEQAVDSGGFESVAQGPLHRVSFGSGYCRHSLMECFEENLEHFPVLLPMAFENSQELDYVRLHNGTIWRWNRPIIGFEKGEPHLRIEHRVIPAGPSVVDQMANIALFYGLVHYFAVIEPVDEKRFEFALAKDNFYQAARHGIDAHIRWIDGNQYQLRHLMLKQGLEFARLGLAHFSIDSEDSDFYLELIRQRLETSQTGSKWQQRFIEKHGLNMQLLTENYFYHQQGGKPVHEWDMELHHVD